MAHCVLMGMICDQSAMGIEKRGEAREWFRDWRIMHAIVDNDQLIQRIVHG
jgi:hypothetical protein